jgi:CBS domain-containing protein
MSRLLVPSKNTSKLILIQPLVTPMTTVQHVLAQKGHKVLSVSPADTVYNAIKLMADENIGSLVVIEQGKLIGIITERHYARSVFLKGRSSPETPVSDVMERNVVCVRPNRTVEECMALMTAKHVRHLPVVNDGKMLGIVSVGDLVKSIISDKEFVIEQLEHYIRG